MFLPMKSDTGNLLPWEYMLAAAGTYQAGQLLGVTGGKVTALTAATTTTPPYLCMADKTVAAGEALPVTRVSRDYIYETQLSAKAASAVPGTKLEVSAGGLKADATAAGTFELVSLEGVEAGDFVRGRWV